MSCSLCWDPCGRTSSKNPSPSGHINMGQRKSLPHHTAPRRVLLLFAPAYPGSARTHPLPFHPPTLDAPRRVLYPLAVDFLSGHCLLRLGMSHLFGVWENQLIRFPQVLEVSKCGKI